MKPFKFCPSCASELEQGDEPHGYVCPGCGRSWYRNSAPTAGCVIVRDGRALVTQRGREPEKGKFDIPGGFLGPGEEPLIGLRREITEELGVEIDVSMDDFVHAVPHEYGPEGEFVLSLGFRARLSSGEPKPADDVANIRWVGPEEIDGVDFAWAHDRDIVRKALSDG